ncbi:MAG: hypothetical protein AAGC76_01955 [Luteibacter sp.]|nr:hypothetical protein [Luteibacter sp.]MDQ7994597.1 hypothetical protein [Luteibacter sp.]
MNDIDIQREIYSRLLAELNRVIADLILRRDYAALSAILAAQEDYQKRLL